MSKPITAAPRADWRKRARIAEVEVARLRRGFDSEIEGYWMPIRSNPNSELAVQLSTAQTLGFRIEAKIENGIVIYRAVRRNRGSDGK